MTSANNHIVVIDSAQREKNVRLIQDAVQDERQYQTRKWGYQHHPALMWLGIGTEEWGEIGKAIIERQPERKLLPEIIQMMAVCQSWLEDFVAGMTPAEIAEILSRPPKDVSTD